MGHREMPKATVIAIPCEKTEVLAAAKALNLPIADACLPGVLANLELLGRHAAILADGSRSPTP